MTAAAAEPPASPGVRVPPATIVAAGLGGGAVDFIYACGVALSRGKPITTPWLSVASGWVGKAAKEMGAGGVALGIVTHFGIALVMAAVYALAATRIATLTRKPLLSGLVYGFILYGVMYGLVLPTRFGRPYQWQGGLSVADILSHMGVALVIALVVSRARRI